MAAEKTGISMERWLAGLDDRGYLYFQPSARALCCWMELLYWRSFSWASVNLVEHWPLARVDRLAPTAMCWWYMADRCARQMRETISPQQVPLVAMELLGASEPAIQRLLQALVDFYDLREQGRRSQWQHVWMSRGRRLVEDFLDWDKIGCPGHSLLCPILRVVALELLEHATVRR